MAPGRKHICIDGNSRTGALHALGDGEFVGTRLTKRGKFEERHFTGREFVVKQEWRAWRDEVRDDATITVSAAKQPKQAGEQMEKAATTNDIGACPYDLSAFTVYGTTPRNAAPSNSDAYVRFGREKTGRASCNLVLSKPLAEIVVETLGGYVRVGVNKAARVLAIMQSDDSGSERKVSYRTNSALTCQISCSQYAEALTDMYGTHRRIYFDAELFNDAVILRPTGEVLD